jgi:hypothetical protein
LGVSLKYALSKPCAKRHDALVEGRNDLLPPLDVGDDLDHVFPEALFVVVPGPPATAIELDEIRPPPLRQTQPLTRRLN